MIRVFVDGKLFYHSALSSLAVTDVKVQEEAGAINSLVLSAPFSHPYINHIKPLTSTILCKKDEQIVFEGRALDEGTDFYNTHTWNCESALAYLKDTYQPPYDYQGTLRGLLEYFINEHNKVVEDKKKFILGRVTVTDTNDYVHYSCSDFSVTMDAVKQKLIDTHGGYLHIRYEKNQKVLEYLSDLTEESLQTVEFGKNLIDVKINFDHIQRITALIPLGTAVKKTDSDGNETDTDKRVDITSVNNGKNYVYDEKAVEEIGWIWRAEVWDDVSQPSNLLKKAKQRLSELVNGVTSMELKVAEESDKEIHAGQYVKCLSAPHGINGRYLVLSKTTDYLNPANNIVTIGAAGIKLTSQSVKQDKNLVSLQDSIYGQAHKVENITSKVDEISKSKMYHTEIIVEGVSIFKNKGQKSTLRCKVYSWDKDITGRLEEPCFNWHRKSDNEETDNDWDNRHKGMKSVNITTEDVCDNASFYCEIKI